VVYTVNRYYFQIKIFFISTPYKTDGTTIYNLHQGFKNGLHPKNRSPSVLLKNRSVFIKKNSIFKIWIFLKIERFIRFIDQFLTGFLFKIQILLENSKSIIFQFVDQFFWFIAQFF
jgi:hypothetical protein